MKRFFLVGGVDIRDNSDAQVAADFYGKLCITRSAELIAEHSKTDDLEIRIFNFTSGTIVSTTIDKKGIKSPPVTLKTFTPVKESDYSVPHRSLSETVFGTLSVLDVYDAVLDTGLNAPGELIELSFFYSHNYSDEPLMVGYRKNYLAYQLLPQNTRIPYNPDMEIHRDFIQPNMDVTVFRDAFHKTDGYARFWAADYYFMQASPDDRYIQLISDLINLKEYKDESLDDDTLIVLKELSQTSVFLIYTFLSDHFQFTFFPHPDNGKVPFRAIRYGICKYIYQSAAGIFVNSTGVRAYGLLKFLRVQSETTGTFPLQKLSGASYAFARFYRKHIGVTLEPVRFYPVISPGESCPKPVVKHEELFPPQPPATVPVVIPTPVEPKEITEPKMEGQQYIFVAGVDFTFSGIDFYRQCISRMKQVLRDDTTGDVKQFYLLDFATGETTFYDSRTIDHPVTIKRFKRIDSADYKEETDITGEVQMAFQPKKGVMNMLAVYLRIFDIGFKLPGKLMELSFFSHANESGPRLLNYFEELNNSSSAGKQPAVSFDPEEVLRRTPQPSNEKLFYDPSPLYDFGNLLMNNDPVRRSFVSAWHGQGITRVWGYHSTSGLYRLMRAVVQSKDYSPSGLTFETVLTLKNPERSVRFLLHRITGDEHGPVRIKVKFGHILYVLSTILKSSYMYHLAQYSERSVYAGLPGTFASFESGAASDLMKIDIKAFGKYVEFFQNYFEFKADPEKRGYSEYVKKNSWDKKDYPGTVYKRNTL